MILKTHFNFFFQNPESLENTKKSRHKTKKISKKKKQKSHSKEKTSKLKEPNQSDIISEDKNLSITSEQQSTTSSKPQMSAALQNNGSDDDDDDDFLIYFDPSLNQKRPDPPVLTKKEKKKKKKNRSKNYLTEAEMKKILESPIFLNLFSDSDSDHETCDNKNDVSIIKTKPTKTSTNQNSINNIKDEDEIIYSDYEYEYEEEEEIFEDSESDEPDLETKRFDLHGYTLKQAKFLVESQILNANKNKIGVFHFITGAGHHSINHIPILRPMVLRICQKLNVRGYIPHVNSGIVVCNVKKPFASL